MKEFRPPGVDNWAIGQDITEERRQREMTERARREAETALKAKSDFLAVMVRASVTAPAPAHTAQSHEIRTPLNGVIGTAPRTLRCRD
jgi:signal transduction histidine kinase